MGNRSRRIILFRFNEYKEIEQRLEKMAAKGLFLEKIGSIFWTFKKAEPRKVKYTVTYFSEASIFNPSVTNNQQAYFNYAKESGWDFVAEFNQMQVFCSEDENPAPLEIDEEKKFENIKTCMRKNFLPSTIALIIVFMMNLYVQYDSYKFNPVDFLSKTSRLFPVAIIIPTLVYLIYAVMAYFIWCKQSKKSLAMGGACVEKTHKYKRVIDVSLLTFDFILIIFVLLDLFKNKNLVFIILIIAYIPILMVIFKGSIAILKKRKKSAGFNRVVSYTLLLVASFGYLFFITTVMMKFDIPIDKKKNYRTVTVQMTLTGTMDYKIYSDNIPLTCEELYGSLDYDSYSYEKEVDNTIFLKRSQFRQQALPDKNSPPEIEYEIFQPRFDFVYKIVEEDFKKVPIWSDDVIKEIDNEVFNTVRAYGFYNNHTNDYTGKYLLVYKDKIIFLKLYEEATEEQIPIIIEKLGL